MCAAASGDPQSLHGAGMIVATGDTTGKIALYDPTCHLSFLSFSSGASDPDPSISSASARSGHSGRITSLVFAKGSQVLLSASVDGTVRAHDLLRYRPSFRVMTTPPHEDGSSLGLSHVMADPSGEFILAIGMNSPFAMYCWHLKTGKLMDLFSGHEAPITATAMDPLGRYCLTGSLDKTVRIWTLFTDANSAELTRSRHESTVLDVGTEITSLAFSPDGKHFLIASLSGLVTAYNTESQLVKFTLSAALDLPHTRSTNDLMVAKNKASQSYYSTVTYSKDGALIVAAGNGPFLVLYEAVTGIFLKVISMSDSLLLDGTLTRLNSKATPVYKNTSGLPGTSTSSLDRRSFFPEMRISHLDFLPDSRTFIALTTEGLSMYSLDGTAFSWQLPHNSILVEGQDITPETIRNCSDPITAFILALSIYDRDKNSARYLLLNPTKKSPSTTKEEVVSVIMSICLALPTTCKYYERILNLLADAFSTNMFNATSDASADTSMMMMVTSFPIDILLTWLNQLLLIHGHGIKQFVGASHSHMARLAASTSTATAAANSSENSVLLVSSNRTASVIIPSLTSLQSSIRKIYQPLMKVTSENTFMLKFLEESLCDH